jgi:hypothetical protein
MANPFYIEPANPLKALMAFDQSYEGARKRTQEDEAKAALQQFARENPQFGPLGQLMATNPGAAKTFSDIQLARENQAFRQQEAQRTQRNFETGHNLEREKFDATQNEPRLVGTGETGYFLVDRRSGQPIPPGAVPQAGQGGSMLGNGEVIVGGGPAGPPAAPGPIPVIPAKPKAPRELTSGDRKTINDSEDSAIALQNTIKNIGRAKQLNQLMHTGWFAGAKGEIGTSGIPGANLIVDEDRAKATVEWNQIMSQKAIEEMSKTLKGASTDFEMKKFLAIAADQTKPPSVRENAMDRFITLANEELQVRMKRFNEIREGTYYKPGGGLSGKDQSQAPSGSNRAAPPAGVVDWRTYFGGQ